MSPREPDAILRELGTAVEAGWAARGRRRPWLRLLGGPRRGLAIVAAALLVLVPTAVATRDAIWAPEPPALPASLQAPGAVAPAQTGSAVYVAQGETRGAVWRLSASACDYGGGARVVGVFLTVPGGGAGARCDTASVPGDAPARLAARRVHTYYDPRTATTWVFGTLPADARRVTVAATGNGASAATTVDALPADPRAIDKGRLPGGLRVFVAALPGAPELRMVTATGEGDTPVLTCDVGACRP